MVALKRASRRPRLGWHLTSPRPVDACKVSSVGYRADDHATLSQYWQRRSARRTSAAKATILPRQGTPLQDLTASGRSLFLGRSPNPEVNPSTDR